MNEILWQQFAKHMFHFRNLCYNFEEKIEKLKSDSGQVEE